ncbi:NAD-dependent epimerase/dehydratase family protein [Cellulomonas alba]|uniref:NAD(P)-dependent oxidoreductase n=1 Tax=Cellulomonas alba TaxID=3053467 RepID=A0ABT7SI21_9CELL|nr:NAD(P)-dependent oxidoreductase [Cellulomonas alba]MDM7855838.1 NAD(P)-dependent oxidoreductase [Cellulomonas alba]
MHVYVAGATGAVGTRLVPMLVERGHRVTGTTTDPAKRALLERMGARAVVVDGLDGAAVGEAVATAEPDAVVHQMTALAGRPDTRNFDRWFALTNRLRTEGLDHLVAAARACGVTRFVAQSYTGWPNARTGDWVKDEDDPLDPDPPQAQRETLAAIRYLEEAVRKVDGTVLRYGALYGGAPDPMVELVRKRRFPLVGGGTGYTSWLHLDDAAGAAVRALEADVRGVFDIVDDEPAPASDWLPYLAECLGAKPPLRLPVWVARLAAGEVAVSMLTRTRGSSNARARRELGWEPIWPSWRQGFRHGLAAGA